MEDIGVNYLIFMVFVFLSIYKRNSSCIVVRVGLWGLDLSLMEFFIYERFIYIYFYI